MAFHHTTGTANNIANFFTLLEAALAAAGWILVAGGGTQDITYRSTGESGARTKLYIRVWQDTAYIRYRVQDDAAGTHQAYDGTYHYLRSVGAGTLPFEYWITLNKDVVIMVLKASMGAALELDFPYSGCYVGAVEPIGRPVYDEEQEYIVLSLDAWSASYGFNQGRVLRRYDGTWNQMIYGDTMINSWERLGAYDGAFGIMPMRVYRGTSQNEEYGIPYFLSGPIRDAWGYNPQDVIQSGIPGATTEWLCFGARDTRYFVLRTVGALPARQTDIGDHIHGDAGSAANSTILANAFQDCATRAGWNVAVFPGGYGPDDRRFFSVGESGLESIYVRIGWSPLDNYWMLRVMDDGIGTHQTTNVTQVILPGDWPVDYEVYCDKDGIWYTIDEGAGPDGIYYGGLAKMEYLDPPPVGTPYKMISGIFKSVPFIYWLRADDGTWSAALGNVSPTDGSYYRLRGPLLTDRYGALPACPVPQWRGWYPIGFPKTVFLCVQQGVVFNLDDFMQVDNGYILKYVKDYYWMRVA
jgi:hypothetical protein